MKFAGRVCLLVGHLELSRFASCDNGMGDEAECAARRPISRTRTAYKFVSSTLLQFNQDDAFYDRSFVCHFLQLPSGNVRLLSPLSVSQDPQPMPSTKALLLWLSFRLLKNQQRAFGSKRTLTKFSTVPVIFYRFPLSSSVCRGKPSRYQEMHVLLRSWGDDDLGLVIEGIVYSRRELVDDEFQVSRPRLTLLFVKSLIPSSQYSSSRLLSTKQRHPSYGIRSYTQLL